MVNGEVLLNKICFSVMTLLLIQSINIHVASENASLDDAPWHCLIQVLYAQNVSLTPKFLEGSLISPQFVLTSANELRNATALFLSFGSTLFFGYPDYTNVLAIATFYYTHPDYNVGVIKLQEPLNVVGPYVKTIDPLKVVGSIPLTYFRLENQPAKLAEFGSN